MACKRSLDLSRLTGRTGMTAALTVPVQVHALIEGHLHAEASRGLSRQTETLQHLYIAKHGADVRLQAARHSSEY